MADSVCSVTETQELGTGLVETMTKKKFNNARAPPSTIISFCLLVFLSYRLETTRKETAKECCYSYATISIDCHFRNAYRKVKELGMSPPIQQHQSLTSLGVAPLPYSCIPVCILQLSRTVQKNTLLSTDKIFVWQMS